MTVKFDPIYTLRLNSTGKNHGQVTTEYNNPLNLYMFSYNLGGIFLHKIHIHNPNESLNV